MKYLLLLLTILTVNLTLAQSDFPDFLIGTWKVENKENYEHWDKLSNEKLKGFAYKLKEGKIFVSEYMQIMQKDSEIIYNAAVINQNNGIGVDFKLVKTDNTFIFENLNHDFPKQIIYKKLTGNELFVQVTDGKQKGFSYKMFKQSLKDTTTSNPNYNKSLAEKLGGDDYGMKSYFFVILKTGTNTTTDNDLISESFKGHMENIHRLVEENKLIVAGPLGKNKNNYRGIFILNNIKSIEDAKTLLQTDPAIKNGLLDYEVFNWYGSAALPEYLPYSDKIWKVKP